jgi:hypothetical protein
MYARGRRILFRKRKSMMHDLKMIIIFLCFFVSANLCGGSKQYNGKHVKNITVLKVMLHWTTFNSSKYLKRRLRYSSAHPGSFNPAVITNKEAHIVFGNMENESQKRGLKQKTLTKVTDYFAKCDKRIAHERPTGKYEKFSID